MHAWQALGRGLTPEETIRHDRVPVPFFANLMRVSAPVKNKK